MNETPQPNPSVTFYGAIPGCRAPVRADASVLGTLRDPRLPVLRSPAGGFVFRLVRVSPNRFHPAVGRVANHLDLQRGESVVSAHQRAVPRISGCIRSRGARALTWIFTAFPKHSAGAGRHPGLDRVFYRERRRLECARAAAGQPARAASPSISTKGLWKPIVGSGHCSRTCASSRLIFRFTSAPRLRLCRCSPCIEARTPTRFRIALPSWMIHARFRRGHGSVMSRRAGDPALRRRGGNCVVGEAVADRFEAGIVRTQLKGDHRDRRPAVRLHRRAGRPYARLRGWLGAERAHRAAAVTQTLLAQVLDRGIHSARQLVARLRRNHRFTRACRARPHRARR